MMDWRRSITLRLTLLFALASTTAFLAAGTIIGFVMENHFVQMDLGEQRGKLKLVQHALGKVTTTKELKVLPQQLDDALVGHPGLSLAVLDAQMKTVYATTSANFPAMLLTQGRLTNSSNKLKPVVWQQNGHDYSGIAATVPSGLSGAPQFTVAIALNIHDRKQFMQVFRDTLWVLFGFGILFSAFLGWIAAHRGLSPVRHIALVAKNISASQLNDRLPLDAVPSELLDLAESFNGMLSRLEASFQRLTNFSSDLAHELRAPVSNLMMQSQVALSKTRSADEYRDVLASNLEEFDRLARMISDMLFLARTDHGLMVPQHDIVNLVAEIQQLIEFYEPLAEESGLTITIHGAGTAIGDRLMIRRALSNLISNALRHTKRGGEIMVTVHETSTGEILLSVENPGADIAPHHIAHLFDRFYRIDPSRLHSGEGVGLGLAITKSIIDAHHGRVTVASQNGVTRFEVILPGTIAHRSAENIDHD